jgi:hypothetical protein
MKGDDEMRASAVLIALLAAVLAFWPVIAVSTVYAQPRSKVLVAQADTNSSIYVGKTCSGKVAIENPEQYIFGMTDSNGACTTRSYLANDRDEALACAEKSCPDCTITDITWMGRFSSSAGRVNDIQNFCPVRR